MSEDTTRNQSDAADPEDSYISLLTSSQRALQAYVYTLVPNANDADDILQRANLVLWKKREMFEQGSNFLAWAFSVVRWETRAWFTERKRQSWLVFDDEITDRIAAIHEGIDARKPGAVTALRQCLGKLTDRQRTLVAYFYQEEKSYEECADLLGSTGASLRVILHRIRRKLKRCIEVRLSKQI